MSDVKLPQPNELRRRSTEVLEKTKKDFAPRRYDPKRILKTIDDKLKEEVKFLDGLIKGFDPLRSLIGEYDSDWPDTIKIPYYRGKVWYLQMARDLYSSDATQTRSRSKAAVIAELNYDLERNQKFVQERVALVHSGCSEPGTMERLVELEGQIDTIKEVIAWTEGFGGWFSKSRYQFAVKRLKRYAAEEAKTT